MTNADAMKEYIFSDPQKWNTWLSKQVDADLTFEVTFSDPSFTGDAIKDVFLASSKLVGSLLDVNSIQKTNFFNSRLDNAAFQVAALSDVGFESCVLFGATFHGSKLHRCNFDFTQLDDATFERNQIHNSRFVGAKGEKVKFLGVSVKDTQLRRSNLRSSSWSKATLRNANFHDGGLIEANFTECKFIGCKFNGVRFGNATLSNCEFVAGSFIRANFKNARLADIEFANVNLLKANFRDAELQNVIFVDCDLTGVDFTGTSIYSADQLKGCTTDRTTIFATDPNENEVTREVKAAKTEHHLGSATLTLPPIEFSVGELTTGSQLRNRQTIHTVTPISFERADGSHEAIVLESLAIAMWGKENRLGFLFDQIQAELHQQEDRSAYLEGQSWLERLMDYELADVNRDARYAAVKAAIDERYAIPYFGSLKSLTEQSLSSFMGFVTFAQETGTEAVVTGALVYGCSVIIIRAAPVIGDAAGDNSRKVMNALGNRIVTMIEAKDKELEDS